MKSDAKTLERIDLIDVKIGLGEQNRLLLSKKLSGLLASTFQLYLKTLYYHWNVTGPNFVGLHGIFEKQYAELNEAADEIAERIRALGHFTPGTIREFTSISSVKDDAELPDSSEQMVRNLLTSHEHCSNEAREVLEATEKAEDDVTTDMMIKRMMHHDKTAWMLRSILQ